MDEVLGIAPGTRVRVHRRGKDGSLVTREGVLHRVLPDLAMFTVTDTHLVTPDGLRAENCTGFFASAAETLRLYGVVQTVEIVDPRPDAP